jgi:SAM-dependent methyltransferase
VLEIGCGEGRIARELTTLGYRVTATDAVPAMVKAAIDASSAAVYVAASAARLPFNDGSFDRVVAYNVLMDVEDVPAAVKQMARVLRQPQGEIVISLVHPFADHGRFESDDPEAPLVLTGSYFGRQRFESTFARDGLEMRFAGWSQPLEAYADALAQAGLAITALREPKPDNQQGLAGPIQPWTRWPLFLWLKARPLPD